ncbi:hypothetical protein Anapl_07073 [Anas platyrhynchos]|uniref:Uncharacterized protein n=1 Tax=Anas platyrhynchos TaxID=8839 RepID=R0JDG8_ANAPL|nr:hypothetical protein Anapl_07073 [Anas platyrhynchos]
MAPRFIPGISGNLPDKPSVAEPPQAACVCQHCGLPGRVPVTVRKRILGCRMSLGAASAATHLLTPTPRLQTAGGFPPSGSQGSSCSCGRIWCVPNVGNEERLMAGGRGSASTDKGSERWGGFVLHPERKRLEEKPNYCLLRVVAHTSGDTNGDMARFQVCHRTLHNPQISSFWGTFKAKRQRQLSPVG